MMFDPENRAEIAARFAARSFGLDDARAQMRDALAQTAAHTLTLFADRGYESVGRFLESTVAAGEQERAADVFVKILQGLAWEAWALARERSGMAPLELNQARAQYLNDTLAALSDSLFYGVPVFLQLMSYEERQATVLQATRSPGQPLVLPGFAAAGAGRVRDAVHPRASPVRAAETERGPGGDVFEPQGDGCGRDLPAPRGRPARRPRHRPDRLTPCRNRPRQRFMMDIAQPRPSSPTNLPPEALPPRRHWLRQLGALDWLYSFALVLGAIFALREYGDFMDGYDKGILILHVPILAAIGWHWKAFRPISPPSPCCR